MSTRKHSPLRGKIAFVLSAISLLALTFSPIADAQDAAKTSPSAGTTMVDANPPGSPPAKLQAQKLQAVATVKESIVVEAGLLTPESAKHLFGGWVADHFAVVQVTIGNHSRDQQFILQDIYFDYSDWALSGVYSNCTGDDGCGASTLQDYQAGTKAGQISSIGALEVHDSLKSASTFSRRNFVVNGLVMIGAAAGGFTILGPTVFGQALTGFTSDGIPALQKFWPDRSIDQQSNLLKYGYQDKLVIAKEDPGKTYAFFPISRFLTSGLAKLYKEEPAVFFNVAELYIDPTVAESSKKKSDLKALKSTIDKLINQTVGKTLTDGDVMVDLLSPCTGTNSNDCGLTGTEDEKAQKAREIQIVKRLLAKASLNCTRVVVNGIMTVDVDTIPATLTKISFDDESKGEALFSDSKDKATGVIEGKYLSNGTPKITAVSVPDDKTAKVDDYIVKDSVAAVAAGSTDSELHFTLQFTDKPLPTGSKLTFQVVKSSSKSVNNDSTGANTTETTNSMTLDYTVSYTATAAKTPATTKTPAATKTPAGDDTKK